MVALSVIAGGADDGEVATLGADGTVERSPLADYPAKDHSGKSVKAGPEPLVWWSREAGTAPA